MPLLKKGILAAGIEGIDFSVPATFISERAGFPKNMRIYRNELRKRYGKSKYGSVAISGGQVMGLGRFEDMETGNQYLLRTSKTKYEKYNTSTSAWESISATDFTGSDDDFFSFANVVENQLIVVSNGVDKIRKWTGTGNNAVLGGNPPLAKFLCYMSPYLLLAHIDDGVNTNSCKLQWPDTGDPENWTTGNADSAVLSNEPSPIRNIARLDSWAAVYKRDSLWLGRADDYDIFIFTCEKTGIGLAASRAFADVSGVHYFMSEMDGNIGFHRWNGGIPEPIDKAVREEIAYRINMSKVNRCFSLHLSEYGEVWFFIVINGKSWPTEIWKYNYRNGFWYYDTCPEMTSAIIYQSVSGTVWDDVSEVWNNMLVSWNELMMIGDHETIMGGSDGYTYKEDPLTANDDGVAVEAVFETGDFWVDALEHYKRWLRLDFWGKGAGKLYIDYSINEGANWTNIPYTSSQAYIDLSGTVYTKTEMYLDILSDKIRFRFRNATAGETFYLRNIYPYYLSREQTGGYR